MIFNELYSCYYHTVAHIIESAIEGTLDRKGMDQIIRRNAFAESGLDIPKALASHRWPLLKEDHTTVLHHKPEMPLTITEKRWLKSLLSDPRVALFDVSEDGLEDIEPLYTPDMFVRFDVFDEGDPFDDPAYITHFKTVLTAFHEQRMVRITFTDRHRFVHCADYAVDHVEYSLKNDRFRAVVVSHRGRALINIASIDDCVLLDERADIGDFAVRRDKKEVILELTDKNNTLNRALIGFSHLEKETVKQDDLRYTLTLRYLEEDETEILIHILSFGTTVKVVAPQAFVEKIQSRIRRQTALRSPK